MMRSRSALAICLAVLLIGGATWERLGGAELAKPVLLAVNNATSSDDMDTTDAGSSADLNATTSDPSSDANLTDTDLMSRQLLSDYVNLEANGQATPDNLSALGDEYASSIVSNDPAKLIDMSDLRTTDDSKANFQIYSDSLSKIYEKYKVQLIAASEANLDPNDFGPDTITFSKKVSTIYGEEATELETMLVPDTFVPDHLKLVNFYLTSAWDMNAIANSDTNPTDAYTAMASETSSDGQEQAILTDIKQLLVSNGIILRNS